jgi:hypothetical protein
MSTQGLPLTERKHRGVGAELNHKGRRGYLGDMNTVRIGHPVRRSRGFPGHIAAVAVSQFLWISRCKFTFDNGIVRSR